MSETETIRAGQRMMHWTCRKCGNQWYEPIVQNQAVKHNADRTEDGHGTTICDTCLDRMGPNGNKQ